MTICVKTQNCELSIHYKQASINSGELFNRLSEYVSDQDIHVLVCENVFLYGLK